MSRTYLPPETSQEEIVDFAQSIHEIERYLATHDSGAALVAPDGTHRPIPSEIFEVLEQVATALANGRGVTVAPYEALLTTQEAADYLSISRPTLVKLLEDGAIPFERRGRHRRVTLRDLVEYQERFRVDRRRALREIAREGQASGRPPESAARLTVVAFPAFFDACALYGATLNDVILRLADGGAYRALWSDGVLDEVRRNVIDDGYQAAEIDRRLNTMREYFPDAIVNGYGDLVETMTCHPKDRHVLAAAVRANADVLVTFNLKDFPPESTHAFEVEIVHPDEFLLDQLDLYPGLVLRTIRELSEDYDSPPMSIDDVLNVLSRAGVPRFAAEARRFLD